MAWSGESGFDGGAVPQDPQGGLRARPGASSSSTVANPNRALLGNTSGNLWLSIHEEPAALDPTKDPAEELLRRLADGDPEASGRLLPLVYEELRQRAEGAMGARAGQTLQPTALVHEAWLKIAGSEAPAFDNRGHFVAVAAKAMRQILIDRARARGSRQRREERVTMCGVDSDFQNALDVLDLGEALSALEKVHPRPAKVAELRFFGGLGVEEVAAVLGFSQKTVYNEWCIARAWLRRAMTDSEPT